MKVTDQHFIKKAIWGVNEKRILLQFNFPPGTKYLHITNVAILYNGEAVDNIFSDRIARIYCVTESGNFSGIPLDRTPQRGSIFRVRIKNCKNQNYEDTSFLFDGNDFKKLDPES